MFEVFDREDASFLNKYEKYFMSADEKVQETGKSYISNMPQYKIGDDEFISDLMSNYGDIYPGWTRLTKFSYVFRFSPDKATMLPHIDLDEESCNALKGIAKRVLIYANPVWKKEWRGGTYFAPLEQYGVNRHHIAKCKKGRFEQEATLVENVPGRAVVFDPSEIHMPQEFSGNTVQRLVFAALIIHPDHAHLLNHFQGPSNENGNAVSKLVLPKT